MLLLYRDNGGHLQLICNIHQLRIQRRELLLVIEIQLPVKLPGVREGARWKERENEFQFLIGNTKFMDILLV